MIRLHVQTADAAHCQSNSYKIYGYFEYFLLNFCLTAKHMAVVPQNWIPPEATSRRSFRKLIMRRYRYCTPKRNEDG